MGAAAMVTAWPIATGTLDEGHHGCTELRIHGVGATTPETLLDHPHVVQIAGDGTAGFYRRWDPDGRPGDRHGDDRHVEGYCWGGLTSRSAVRALWVLLVPFMLVNLAHWSLPPNRRGTESGAAKRLLRLLGMTLTATLALGAAEVGVDLLARQCGSTSCFNSAPSWAKALQRHPQSLIAVASLLPVFVLGLVAWLGRRTLHSYEDKKPFGAEREAGQPALADPGFWDGAEPVGRLQGLHLAAGLCAAAVVQALPAFDGHQRVAARTVIVVAGVVLLAASAVALGDGVERPHSRQASGSPPLGRVPWALAGLAGVTLVAAVVVDLLPRAVGSAGPHPTVLRHLDGLNQGLFALQLLLVAGLLVAVVARSRGRRRWPDRLIAPTFALAGWAVAWIFTAGLAVRVARQLLGDAKNAVPPSYVVAGALIGPALVIVVIVAAAVASRSYRRNLGAEKSCVERLPVPGGPGCGAEPGAGADASSRVGALAATRARARLLDSAPGLGVLAGVIAGAVAVVALVADRFWGYFAYRPYVRDLADLGTLLLGFVAAWLITMTTRAFKDQSTRRTIGILWDIGTFWPRAAHPFAPPSYGERALPDLQHRLTFLAGDPDDRVVVAGHSQGSVIAAALVLMPRPATLRGSVRLLTYGCPIGRLYGRVFPLYFGPDVLVALGAAVLDPPDWEPSEPETVRARSTGWISLYRATDPVGGYVFVDVEARETTSPFGAVGARTTAGGVDVVLVDPPFATPPGDTSAPAAAGHSHYREDPTYDHAVSVLCRPDRSERGRLP